MHLCQVFESAQRCSLDTPIFSGLDQMAAPFESINIWSINVPPIHTHRRSKMVLHISANSAFHRLSVQDPHDPKTQSSPRRPIKLLSHILMVSGV